MILFTCPKRLEAAVTARLKSQHIDYVLQAAGKNNLNVYFGRSECLEAIRLIATRPLNMTCAHSVSVTVRRNSRWRRKCLKR